MSEFLMALPGRDYPIGYLIALIFFIIAIVLFIISFFIKEETKNTNSMDYDDGTDLYSENEDTHDLEYTENFADEIVRLIEEEEVKEQIEEILETAAETRLEKKA